MKSKITLAGHPIHPMLVSFPIALYTAAFACFVAYEINLEPFWFHVGIVANVTGILTSLVAAIPGLLDWALAIPEDHPAKKTGIYHLSFNLLAFALFTINAWLHVDQWNTVFPVTIGAVYFSGFGLLSTAVAGFFGWKLVQTHHLGVDLTPDQERLELAQPQELPREEQRPKAG